MSQRSIVAAISLSVCISQLVGCGDYSADPKGAGGSTSSAAGTATTAGTGGSAGSTATTGGSSAGGALGGGGAGSGAGGRETPPVAACENVTACGGDAAGVWFATSSCLPVTGIADLSGLGIGCPEAPSAGKLEVTGNLTLSADGKLSDNTSTSGSVVLELAPPCLDVSGTVTECDKIAAPMASLGFDKVECTDSTTTTGGCTCTGTVKQKGSMGWVLFLPPNEGTYMTANNALTLSTNVKTVDYAYCVEGNFMKVTPTTKTAVGVTSGTIVLQRQP